MSSSLADQVRAARAPKVPPGWLTLAQLAKVEGLSHRGNFYYTAQEAVAAGLLRKKSYRVALGNGIRAVAHYKRVK